MTYGAMGQLVPPIAPIADPWYQRKARQLQRVAAATAGLGQSAGEPSVPGRPNIGMMVGWGIMVAASAGIFWAVTQGVGMKRRVRTNRRRHRRTSKRRRRTRRNVRRYDDLPKRWVAYRVYHSPTSRIQIGQTFSRKADADKRMHQARRDNSPDAVVRSVSLYANTRRGGKRRTSKRRSSPRYKGLTASSRRRMPPSSFALSGKRFPIEGPPGSSRARDRWQAEQAIKYLDMGRVGSKRDYLDIRNAIVRAHGMGFWRSHKGPSWNRVQQAKRKRATTRRRGRRTTRRRVAANRGLQTLYWGRMGGRWYVQAPNYKVRFYSSRDKAERIARSLARQYEVSTRRQDGRALTRNARRTSKRRSKVVSRAGYALGLLRKHGISPHRAGLNPRVAAYLSRQPAGLYRTARGYVTKFKSSTSLQGAMTNTRIAADRTRETHWLVKVYRTGRPKVVVVRRINPKGKTVYRAEETAQRAMARRRAAS